MVLHETNKGQTQWNESNGLPETIFGQTTCLNYCPHLLRGNYPRRIQGQDKGFRQGTGNPFCPGRRT